MVLMYFVRSSLVRFTVLSIWDCVCNWGKNNLVCLHVSVCVHLSAHWAVKKSSIMWFLCASGRGTKTLLVSLCAACLAVWSAASLPSVPTCALVQASVTFWAIKARLLTVSAVFKAVVDVNVLLFRAKRAAWESEIILTYLGWWLGLSKKNSQPYLMPMSSAWNTAVSYTHLTLPTTPYV